MLILLRYFLLVLLGACPAVAGDIVSSLEPQILILNSYHKGYSWSDQIIDGIESNVLLQYPEANVRVEYMDTKRNSSKYYMEELSEVYQIKFSDQKFDLIFASDDNAINYLIKVRDALFPDVPIVFCGANKQDGNVVWKGVEKVTGVLEYADIRQTIDLALQLQPGTKKLVVVNDKTITGKSIGREFDRFLIENKNRFEITQLEDEPLDQLAQQLSQLPGDAIVLLLAYLRDKNGVYYDPAHTANILSKASSVPLYGVWDFYFNHGIVGGVMTSGHQQGEAAAKLGIQILQGKPVTDLPIGSQGGNRTVFDYNAMQRFNLPVDKLPQSSIVKNIKYLKQKNILILHSYSADNAWTHSIQQGLEKKLATLGLTVNTSVEYMDTKSYSSSSYLWLFEQLLVHKYKQTKLDVIVVSDDNAYNFIVRHRPVLFKDVPIVFCGVNYLENTEHLPESNITGVVESYDILGTLELGLTLLPETEHILVINDDTTTGRANRKRLTDIAAQLPANVHVHFIENTSMHALQRRLALLGEDTLVLLMSFTKDKNNHRFSYQQSVSMISEASSRPVFGFWDFYMGGGVLGGVITSGFDQGDAAGNLVVEILKGRDINSLPVITKSPVRTTLDYEVMQKYGLEDMSFADKVEILNKPISLFEEYPDLVYTFVIVVAILLLLIVSQTRKIFFQKKNQIVLSEKAETDPLTGIKNRGFLMRSLEKHRELSVADKQPLVICYFDLDNLKQINDKEGHRAGDAYILKVVAIVERHIRSTDVLCRVGGDEFVIVLPHCSSAKADDLWTFIYNDLHLEKQAGNLSEVTGISYGYAELDPLNPVSSEALIETADQNMYKHKLAKKR